MLGIGDSITDDRLKEGLENTASLLVDHCKIVSTIARDLVERALEVKETVDEELTGRDTLHTTTTSKTTDSRLGNTLDVVAQDLAMTLGAALSKALSAFTTCKKSQYAGYILRLVVVDRCAMP